MKMLKAWGTFHCWTFPQHPNFSHLAFFARYHQVNFLNGRKGHLMGNIHCILKLAYNLLIRDSFLYTMFDI